MATKIRNTTSTSNKLRLLRGVVRGGLKSLASQWRRVLLASIFPILLIALLRWLSDDQTGAQYDVLIAIISLFTTMVIIRIAVAGWDRPKVKLIAYYNGVMMRILSVIGLSAIFICLSVPALGGFILVGLSLVREISLAWLILTIPLTLSGMILMLGSSFAIYAILDDMSLTVMQAYRVSWRLARQYWKPLTRFAIGFILSLALVAFVLAFVSRWTPLSLQDPQLQIVLDALISWLITPIILFIFAAVYQRLLEDYE